MGRVTNEQILDAVHDQQDELLRVEERLSKRISEVKQDCEGDVKSNKEAIRETNKRIDDLQRQARSENWVGSIIAALVSFFGSIAVPR